MKQETEKLLDKADRAIRAAELLLAGGAADFAAGRAYYAMFYTAGALLNEKGLRFQKHGGLHGAFGEHFAKTGVLDRKFHRWLLDAFDRRITADYGVEAVITTEETSRMIDQAREFLQEARRHLGEAEQT
ncbi:MAG: HEPN domain-containing protein [Planctomycetes bacterium]|nr:HEPN domain-containing protein [Planctomycetota bacterium]